MGSDRTGPPRAVADVDLAAVEHNVRLLAEMVRPRPVCAVVKADGYGHGAVEVAAAARAGGARWLAVAHPAEGAALRLAGLGGPVLLLSEPVPSEIEEVVRSELTVAVYTEAGVERLAATRASIAVHLKVNTGMNRVGAQPGEVAALARRIEQTPTLHLEGLWTHCAVADEPGHPFTAMQLERFAAVVDDVRRCGIEVPLVHAANSALTITCPEGWFDLVRPGIACYGVPPAPAMAGALPLRPALTLRSQVTFTRTVPAGEGVSYGLRHRVATDTVVATVPLGYADGVPRRWGLAGGRVLIGGQARPVVGVVTMDQLMVDCGPGAGVAPGDEVVVIGSQGGARIDPDDLAGPLDTISYEILTGISRRVPRRYLR